MSRQKGSKNKNYKQTKNKKVKKQSTQKNKIRTKTKSKPSRKIRLQTVKTHSKKQIKKLVDKDALKKLEEYLLSKDNIIDVGCEEEKIEDTIPEEKLELEVAQEEPVEIEEVDVVDEIDEIDKADDVDEIDKTDEDPVKSIEEKKLNKDSKSILEQIMFSVPLVKDPIIGTPKDVQKRLDKLAKQLQKYPSRDDIFNKIHLYMHNYLINIVFKKFPYIRGYQNVDIYQESLIALKFKAIPNFKLKKGMSFLNFAKMCIRRHLITILNAVKTRQRDRSMNTAISLDSTTMFDNDDGDEQKNTLMKFIPNKSSIPADKEMEKSEVMSITKKTLFSALSNFEKTVLSEFLADLSYDEIAINLTQKLRKKYGTKSIDNALLRIRKKAGMLRKNSRMEDIPLFM